MMRLNAKHDKIMKLLGTTPQPYDHVLMGYYIDTPPGKITVEAQAAFGTLLSDLVEAKLVGFTGEPSKDAVKGTYGGEARVMKYLYLTKEGAAGR